MDLLVYAAEIIATFSESAVALATVTSICKPRYRGFRHVLLLSLFSAGLTAIVLLLNEISLFSYITPIAAILFVTLISSRVTSVGSLLGRCSFCIFAYTVIQTMDYVTLVFFGLALGIPQTVFAELMEPGPLRVAYILMAKLIDIALYLVLRPIFRKIEKLSRKLQIFFFGLSIVTYIYMQFLFSTIVSTELPTMQFAVILSWLFLLCFMVSVFALFSSLTKAEREKQMQMLLETENEWMTDNYQKLHTAQQKNAQQLHDFKNHLLTIQGLDVFKNPEKVSGYIDGLLCTAYSSTMVCHSGNDVIDAIINRKAAEALEYEIDFKFTANFHIASQMSSIEICGILANQIDNAFDACKLISDTSERQVTVSISQREGFAFFRVENTVVSDPFLNNPDLRSTKEDDSSPHGIGLLSIKTIAEKYNGSLHLEYRNNRFISLATVCFEPFNT